MGRDILAIGVVRSKGEKMARPKEKNVKLLKDSKVMLIAAKCVITAFCSGSQDEKFPEPEVTPFKPK